MINYGQMKVRKFKNYFVKILFVIKSNMNLKSKFTNLTGLIIKVWVFPICPDLFYLFSFLIIINESI